MTSSDLGTNISKGYYTIMLEILCISWVYYYLFNGCWQLRSRKVRLKTRKERNRSKSLSMSKDSKEVKRSAPVRLSFSWSYTVHRIIMIIIIIIIIMKRQFIRRRNMSMKSLQGRRTPGSRDEFRTAPDATDLSHWPAFRQLWNYIHHRHHYYSARKLILILPSHRG